MRTIESCGVRLFGRAHSAAHSPGVFRGASAALIASGMLACPAWVYGQTIGVRIPEGFSHGYLVLRDEKRKIIASGELTQTVEKNRIVSQLVYHFRDGSLDEESTIFVQGEAFHLVRDQHIQKGPSFPRPYDVTIDATPGEVLFQEGAKPAEIKHMELPSDLSNGLVLTSMKNLPSDKPEIDIPYLAVSPKPRLVTLAISPEGEDSFTVGALSHKTMKYIIKVKLGGLTGAVAPLIDQKPPVFHVWVTRGTVPTIIRVDGPLYEGGPVWCSELASAVW